MRRVLAVAAIATVAGLAAPALAAPTPPPLPVGVYRTQDGRVCVWVSLQVPQCTPSLNAASR